MSTKAEVGLRSDGELVQAVSNRAVDEFEFVDLPRTAHREEKDHGGWIEILDVSAPISRTGSDPDDDDGLPDVIVWCLDGDGTGSAAGEEIMITYEIMDRTWSVNGEQVDDAGMSSLLFL